MNNKVILALGCILILIIATIIYVAKSFHIVELPQVNKRLKISVEDLKTFYNKHITKLEFISNNGQSVNLKDAKDIKIIKSTDGLFNIYLYGSPSNITLITMKGTLTLDLYKDERVLKEMKDLIRLCLSCKDNRDNWVDECYNETKVNSNYLSEIRKKDNKLSLIWSHSKNNKEVNIEISAPSK